MVLGVAVLVVAILALREPKGHVSRSTGTPRTKTIVSTVTNTPKPSASQTGSSSSAPSTSAAAVKAVPLIVLNNTTIAGLARTAAQKLRADGWTVTRYDNYRNAIVSTCAYYDPAVPGAQAAAQALQAQYSWIKRSKVRFPELPSGPVVLVLTAGLPSG